MQTKVEICGINTSKLKVLRNEETMALIRRAQAGERRAKDEAVMGNLRLVLSVVQRFSSRGEPMDDLFQVGVIGLLKAIDNFDTNQPVKFSTYGVPMIIGEIRRYLRDGSRVKISRSIRDNAYRALTAKERLTALNQREPTMEEIAKEVGLPREEVIFALDAIADPVSLYEPVFQDGTDSVCVMDQVRDERSTDDSWLDQIAMKQAMEALTPREKRILALRFYDGKTQVEVSGEVGISQAQVSRLEKGVLDKIKRCMR
ncbi:MAG: RNA polymerase sporulation sigma factor SigG [Clostridia bacterium]|nr:RNA polymerase sporulation sigma factor SigG [Clostridia bacterium]MBR6574672.1 RNA polymerase sporulation sigma factor SigG [Clostridia bacterium]